jgi:hypothetical protein
MLRYYVEHDNAVSNDLCDLRASAVQMAELLTG